MVLGIFLLAFFVGYLIRGGVRLVARHFSGPHRRSKQAQPTAPSGLADLDDQVHAWTALDDVQLNRLLRDSAPQ